MLLRGNYLPPSNFLSQSLRRLMKRSIFSIALFLVSHLISAAVPIDGWYGSLFGGYSYLPNNLSSNHNNYYWSDANYQSGYNVGGRFGYKSNPLRYEGELTYINAGISHFALNNIRQSPVSGSINDVSIMANIYYDFPEVVRCIEPFLGFGIGYSWVNSRFTSNMADYNTSFSQTENAFGYQGTGGLTFNYFEYFSLDVAYRYLGTNKIANLGESFQANLITAGATYRFDDSHYK